MDSLIFSPYFYGIRVLAEYKDRRTCTHVIELLWKEITRCNSPRLSSDSVSLQTYRVNSVTTPYVEAAV